MTQAEVNRQFYSLMGREITAVDWGELRREFPDADLDALTKEQVAEWVQGSLEYKRRSGARETQNILAPGVVDRASLTEEQRKFYDAAVRSGATWVDRQHFDWAVQGAGHGITPEQFESELRGDVVNRPTSDGRVVQQFSADAIRRMGGSVSRLGTNAGDLISVPAGTQVGAYWQKVDTRDGQDLYVAAGSPKSGIGGKLFGSRVGGFVDRSVGRAGAVASFTPLAGAGFLGDEIASLGGTEGWRQYQNDMTALSRPVAQAGRTLGANWSAEGVSENIQIGEAVAQNTMAAVGDAVAFGGLPVLSTANRLGQNAALSARGQGELIDWRTTGRDVAIDWGTAGILRGANTALTGRPLTAGQAGTIVSGRSGAVMTAENFDTWVSPALNVGTRTAAGGIRGQEWDAAFASALSSEADQLMGYGPVLRTAENVRQIGQRGGNRYSYYGAAASSAADWSTWAVQNSPGRASSVANELMYAPATQVKPVR